MAKCNGTTKAGDPCKRPSLPEQDFCPSHLRDSAIPEPVAETVLEPVTEDPVFTDEMRLAAIASAKAASERRKEEPKQGVGVMRKKGDGPGSVVLHESDIPYPQEAHGDDFEDYGPSGMAAVIPDGTEIAPYSGDQEFMIEPGKVKNLLFTQPGRNLPKHRLYTIKAFHRDGRLVQLPFESQIQNNAGGDPEDAIGLRRYQRKGMTILVDWDTLIPIYCAAWDCWAKARRDGFCSDRHAQHTLPNKYKDADQITSGIFGEGATTSRTWSV